MPKKTSHFDSCKNNFKTALRSGNMFCIKFHVLLKVFSIFLVEIQLFSAQKQMFFVGVFSTPYLHGGLRERLQRWRPSYRSSSLKVHWGNISPTPPTGGSIKLMIYIKPKIKSLQVENIKLAT